MYKKIKFSASAMCFDWLNVKPQLKEIENLKLDYLHIDIIDGNFVPDFTMGSSIINSLRSATSMRFYFHLMVDEPRRIFDSLNIKKKDILTIHQEASKNLHSDLVEIRNIGAEVGIALSPGTPLDSLEYVIEDADNIILMTVNPGFGGQSFIPSMLGKISNLNDIMSNYDDEIELQVDGGVKPQNAGEIKESGASVLVAGSAIFNSKDYKKAIKSLREA